MLAEIKELQNGAVNQLIEAIKKKTKVLIRSEHQPEAERLI